MGKTMEGKNNHWFIEQLSQLAHTQPEKLDELIAHVQEFRPDLYEKLVLMALEQGELDHQTCAVALSNNLSQLAGRLEIFQNSDENGTVLIETDAHGVARLSEAKVTVWEIVREFRKVNSIQELNDNYPALTLIELSAALQFAENNGEEIEKQIQLYEDHLNRTKAAYPFS